MNVKTGKDIPFEDLANQIFDDSPDQKLIPFLGAGVPLSAAPAQLCPGTGIEFPDREKIDEALNVLSLTGPPRVFAAFALVTAYLMSAAHDRDQCAEARKMMESLVGREYPPSSCELTALFSALAKYSPLDGPAATLRNRVPPKLVDVEGGAFLQILQRLLEATGVSSGDSLTSVAGYYELQAGRERLWDVLEQVFESKKTPTPTHDLLADAAAAYLGTDKHRVVKDYLIVTTNYDCLMEIALANAKAPYAVLSLSKKDGKIHVMFSKDLEELDLENEKNNPPAYANQFLLTRRDPLVVVYKIHGGLFSGCPQSFDSVVISDNDYVEYISRMSTNEGVIPVCVGTLMRDKPFLFLGYSLKDWNVRSVFETMTRKRGAPGGVLDYLVTRGYSPLDEAYYEKHRIRVLKSTLSEFVSGIRAHIDPNPEGGAAHATGTD
jgi:hypothetical protein